MKACPTPVSSVAIEHAYIANDHCHGGLQLHKSPSLPILYQITAEPPFSLILHTQHNPHTICLLFQGTPSPFFFRQDGTSFPIVAYRVIGRVIVLRRGWIMLKGEWRGWVGRSGCEGGMGVLGAGLGGFGLRN